MKNKAVFLKLRQPESLLFVHFFLSAAAGFLFFMPVLISLVQIEDSSEAVFSTRKLFFLAVILFVIGIFLLLAFYFLIRSDHARKIFSFIFKDARNKNTLLRAG